MSSNNKEVSKSATQSVVTKFFSYLFSYCKRHHQITPEQQKFEQDLIRKKRILAMEQHQENDQKVLQTSNTNANMEEEKQSLIKMDKEDDKSQLSQTQNNMTQDTKVINKAHDLLEIKSKVEVQQFSQPNPQQVQQHEEFQIQHQKPESEKQSLLSQQESKQEQQKQQQQQQLPQELPQTHSSDNKIEEERKKVLKLDVEPHKSQLPLQIQYESDLIQQICSITLNPNRQYMIFVGDILKELQKNDLDGNYFLNIEVLQKDIFFRLFYEFKNKDASKQSYFKAFQDKLDFLFRIVSNCLNNGMGKVVDKKKFDLLASIKDITVRYLISLLLFPQCFVESKENLNQQQLKEQSKKYSEIIQQQFHYFYESHFLLGQEIMCNIYDSIIRINRDLLPKILNPLIHIIMHQFAQASIQNMKPFENALFFLTIIQKNDELLKYFIEESQQFYPKQSNNNQIHQVVTLMERLLAFSSFADESKDWGDYFMLDFSLQKKNKATNNVTVIRQKFNNILDQIYQFLQCVLKSSSVNGKHCVIEFFKLNLEQNIDYTKLVNKKFALKPKGYIINMIKLLMKFTENATSDFKLMMEKINLVNVEQLLEKRDLFHNYDQVYQIEKEKLLVEKEQQSAEQLKSSPDKNKTEEEQSPMKESQKGYFLTELCRLCLIGLKILSSIFEQKIHIVQQLTHLQAAGDNNNPMIMKLQSVLFSFSPQLDDPMLITLSLRFMSFFTMLALKENKQEFDLLSINNEITLSYSRFPILYIENIYNVINHLYMTNITIIDQSFSYYQFLVNFCCILLQHDKLCSNPHIRSQLLLVFCRILPQKNHKIHKQYDLFLKLCNQLFLSNPVTERYLMRGMLEVFILCEKTGAQHQFEEKFMYREGFCRLFNFLFKFSNRQPYVLQFKSFLANEKVTFIQFANLIFSDITHSFDTCIQNLQKIKELEKSNPNTNNPALQQELFPLKIQINNFGNVLSQNLKTISVISKYAQDALLVEEIRQKVVLIMDYIVNNLNNSDAGKLYKIKDIDKIQFKPKVIIKHVIRMYNNLSEFDEFIQEIVNDERSFSQEVFMNALKLMRQHQIISEIELSEFEKLLQLLTQKCNYTKQINQIMEQVKVPQEFYDQLTNEIMKDPVKLPSSGTIIDRLTIRKHLLNDKSDPYTRQPLTENMLIEMPELKQKIQDFYKEIEQKFKEQQQAQKKQDKENSNKKQEDQIKQ